MGEEDTSSISRSRYSALEGIQQLVALIDEVPSVQLRLMMQAACLDVASSVEELSSLAIQPSVAGKTLGSTGEVA